MTNILPIAIVIPHSGLEVPPNNDLLAGVREAVWNVLSTVVQQILDTE